VTVEIAGQSVHLHEAEWSRWVDLDFRVNFLMRIHGFTQFYLVRSGQELQALCLAGKHGSAQSADRHLEA